jgi:hypothetical protein
MSLGEIVAIAMAQVDEEGMTMGSVIAAVSSNAAFQTLCASDAITKSAIREEIRRQLTTESTESTSAPKRESAFVAAGAAAEADSSAADAPYVPNTHDTDAEAAAAADDPLEIVARALGTEPLAARAIAKLCGWKGRKSVNKHLYALQRASRALKVDGSPPLWAAAGSSKSSSSGGGGAATAAAGGAEPLAKRPRTGEVGSAATAVGAWAGASASADDTGSYYLLHRGKEEKRITVTMFGGAPRVDLRGWYDAGDGAMKPGRKGIMLSKQHWTMLMAAAPEITRRLDAL